MKKSTLKRVAAVSLAGLMTAASLAGCNTTENSSSKRFRILAQLQA